MEILMTRVPRENCGAEIFVVPKVSRATILEASNEVQHVWIDLCHSSNKITAVNDAKIASTELSVISKGHQAISGKFRLRPEVSSFCG